MIMGESVVIHRRIETGTDEGNNPIYAWDEQVVEDVVVAPGPRTDVDDSNRPEGVQVSWTLHFPKMFAGTLRGCEIAVRGGPPAPVIGDPKPYTLDNTPGRWNMPVELERVDG